jgi:thiamine-phosphate pyrophosphorylase
MASRGNQIEPRRPAPRIYLVTPPVADPAGLKDALASAVGAGDVAAVLVRVAATDERTMINRVKVLAPIVQGRGAALLVDGHPEIVARAGADGAHMTGVAALAEALALLKPARIAGCGGLASRHDAMVAAESGADYVMFGEPDEDAHRPSFEAVLDRVAWWAEVFEIPCVGFAASVEETEQLAAAGADFVALGDAVFGDARGPAVAMAEAARRLAAPEAVR